jgi:hypothetical protein
MYTYPILVGACTTIHIIWDLGDWGSPCHILNAKSHLCSWNGPKLVGSFFSFTLIIMKLFGSLFTFNTIRYVLGDWCLGAGYSLQWVSSRARVNQQPPMHQLAVLSTGWGAFFHLAPSGVHRSPFLFTVDCCFFLTIFSLDMTSHIATLLTFLPL